MMCMAEVRNSEDLITATRSIWAYFIPVCRNWHDGIAEIEIAKRAAGLRKRIARKRADDCRSLSFQARSS